MGISISYHSEQKPADSAVQAIKAEAARLRTSWAWWSECISFFDWDCRDGYLTGDTELMPMAYFGQVNLADHSFMAGRDLLFILEQLATWSHNFKIDWKLECCDQMGRIVNGEFDADAQTIVANWRQSAGIPADADPQKIEQKALQLLSKYSFRTRTWVTSH